MSDASSQAAQIDNGRHLPKPGEWWRLHYREPEIERVNPCGHKPPSVSKELRDRYEGRVFEVVMADILSYCLTCGWGYRTEAGEIAILLPDWRGGTIGNWLQVTVPYTWLEPEDWRKP